MYDNVRTHPGANIRDCMEAEGLTVSELSERLGFNRTTVSRLLNGHHGGDGAGAGAQRLEQRRLLDAVSGEL